MTQIIPPEVKNSVLDTFQLRLGRNFKDFLMSKRAETGRSMKSLVQEAISEIYNFWPEPEEQK